MTQQTQKKVPLDKLEEDWNWLQLWFFLLFSWIEHFPLYLISNIAYLSYWQFSMQVLFVGF